MYWFLWKSWFCGQSKSTHFNANPWISTDINDFLWKSRIFKENVLQCISKKSNEFIWNPLTFHEFEWISIQIYEFPCKKIFQCISMIFHKEEEFQLNHDFQYFSKRFYLFIIKLKSVFFHWVSLFTLSFINAHGNALVYLDVHWNSMCSINIHWFYRENIGEWCFSVFGHVW